MHAGFFSYKYFLLNLEILLRSSEVWCQKNLSTLWVMFVLKKCQKAENSRTFGTPCVLTDHFDCRWPQLCHQRMVQVKINIIVTCHRNRKSFCNITLYILLYLLKIIITIIQIIFFFNNSPVPGVTLFRYHYFKCVTITSSQHQTGWPACRLG